MPPITLRVQNFKALHRLEWSFEGVCLLVGPNGSGKTTALEAIAFLRDAFETGLPSAIDRQQGLEGLRRLGSAGPVRLELQVRQSSWGVHVANEENGAGLPIEPGALPSSDLEPLERVLRSFRIYGRYRPEGLRSCGAGEGDDSMLSEDGLNLFSLLRRWRRAPKAFGDRYSWVLSALSCAFPGKLEDLDLLEGKLPLPRAADGLLVGLLQLVAVAGAEDGALIALDPFERALHPHAIRRILEAIRERADDHGLTVLLTSHSLVVMNSFRHEARQVVVMVPDQAHVPLERKLDAQSQGYLSVWEAVERILSEKSTQSTPCQDLGSHPHILPPV